MSYRIEFVSSAEREFLRLPKSDKSKVGEKINSLSKNPRPSGCVKMAGYKNLWRIRVGDYRVIYSIEDALRVVSITRIGNRRDVYRGL